MICPGGSPFASIPAGLVVAAALLGIVPQARGESQSLARGTPVYLELTETISSDNVRAGTPIVLRVALDVRSGGEVVIARGAPASGVVEAAESSGIVGKAGTLVLRATSCTAVDGSRVLLQGAQRLKGAEYVEESAAIAGMVCCLGVFLRGKKVETGESKVITASVFNDVEIDLPDEHQTGGEP